MTMSGAITASFPVPTIHERRLRSKEIEFGSARFRLEVRLGSPAESPSDHWIECFLINKSQFAIKITMSVEVLRTESQYAGVYRKSNLDSNICPAERGFGWPRLIRASILNNPANQLLASDCFTVRANISFVHPGVTKRTAFQDSYPSVQFSIASLFESEIVATDFCIIAIPSPDAEGGGASKFDDERESALEVDIPAHKLILAARSPVLRAMLSSGMKESCVDEMEITGYAVEAVRAFVRFLYTDSCGNATLDAHAWELLALADKYDVPALRHVCETYLATSLSVENAVALFVRADAVNALQVRHAALAYIATHSTDLLGNAALLAELDAGLVREILLAVVEVVKSEQKG
jgi:speckle-type POZ protein